MKIRKWEFRERSTREIGNKFVLPVLLLMMFSAVLGNILTGAEASGTEDVAIMMDAVEETITTQTGISNDQAAEGYINRIMAGEDTSGSVSGLTARGENGRTLLTGREARLYDALKPLIAEVAAGKRSVTEFEIPIKDVYESESVTAAELGYESFNQGNANAAAEKLTEIDSKRVISALLVDCPYELYWFDKTVGMGRNTGGLSYNSEKLYFRDYENGTFQVTFAVAKAYQNGGQYVVNTVYGQSATAAAENARAIVSQNAGKGDYLKLTAYKDAICDLVSYNTEAAENQSTAYGDPWQMIWVFDGNPNTKVVCEGYSKAFQYLCDESRFIKVGCFTVHGTMTGGTGAGGHMWNIVRMGSDYYLADITNSDTGTIGQNGGLFLDGYDSTSTASNGSTVYWYNAGSGKVGYVFDDEMVKLYGTNVLKWEDTAYDTAKENKDYVVENGVLVAYNGYMSDFWIPEELGVTAIGDELFFNEYWLQTVTIPEGVTTIGARAFRENIYLRSIQLPESLRIIKDGAFSQNSNLRTINIPSGVQEIGNSVFLQDNKLAEILLPEGIASIGDELFMNCTALKEIHIPDSVKTIGESAFQWCSTLKKITVPDGVTEIGKYAFKNCNALEEVIIPASVTSIGADAFASDSKVTARVYWGSEAASHCSLYKVNYKYIGSIISAGLEDKELKTIPLGETAVVVAETEPDASWLFVYYSGEDLLEKWPATEENCELITNYDGSNPRLSWHVTVRPERMTNGLYIISGWKEEAPFLDWGWKWTRLLVHRDGFAYSDSGYLWGYVGDAEELTIPDSMGITCIENDAFKDNNTLQYLTLPSTLTSNISEEVFKSCSALKLIRYPSDAGYFVVDSRKRAIGSILSLETDVPELGLADPTNPEVTFTVVTDVDAKTLLLTDNQGKTLAQWDRAGCSREDGWNRVWDVSYQYAKYTAQNGKMYSGTAANAQINALNVKIDVRYIIYGTRLQGWKDQGDVVIPESLGIKTIGSMLIDTECRVLRSNVTSVTLPEGITQISFSAFRGAQNLEWVTLPETLEKIENAAFWKCPKLTEMEIPRNVKSIADTNNDGERVFDDDITLIYDCDTYAAEWNETQKYNSIVRHDWHEIEYIWAEDNSTVTARKVCGRDENHSLTEVVKVIQSISAPTETEAGYMTLYASFENDEFETQSREREIKPLGESGVLRIPAGTTTIESGAFEGVACEAVILPEGCRTIESGAFADCERLGYIYVPAGCEIMDGAFEGCEDVVIDRR